MTILWGVKKGSIKMDKTKEIISKLRIVLAIEMLEYEDMNYLAGNNKSRSEEKMALLTEILQTFIKENYFIGS
jgi:hypothetical protein